ncbi:MAG: SURF1 family protein [Methyloceanibacter sp.]
MTAKGLVALTATVLAALAVLIGLGLWQLNRLHWKEGVIAQIEARSKAPPITLDGAIALANEGRDPSYYRVRVEGRFHHERERHYYATSDGKPGWHVITPLQTADGDKVLVDRGFVPEDLKDPAARPRGQIEEIVTITGIVRAPEVPGLFTPDNEPETNRWFWRDLTGMTASMFPEGVTEVAPFFLEAEAGDVPGGWPRGGQTRLTIVNNHLQYAITWFALAACLAVIYAVYVFGAYRGKRP